MPRFLRMLLLGVCLISVTNLVKARPLRMIDPPRDLSVEMFYHGLTSNFGFSLDSSSGIDGSSTSGSQVNSGRLMIVGGLMSGGLLAIHIYQQNGWWKNNRRSFHFEEDLTYALNFDKIGHFYGAAFLTFVFSKSLEWADVPEPRALLFGSLSSILFQTYVEVEDGYSAWGFDRVDFAADLLGAWYPLLSYHIPSLKNFDLKFSYLPSKNVNAPGGFPGQRHLLLNDYEGQTLWLSMKVNNIVPESVEKYWPDFLCVTFGYAGRGFFAQTQPFHEN